MYSHLNDFPADIRQAQVHFSFSVGEEAEACHLFRHPVNPLRHIVVGKPHQQAETPPDGACHPAFNRD